ncbi:MAG: hypothetical protein HUJ63_03530, partial [Enterococcus sp.]|nr:hypothetical protein [Enterococcus sp.]
MAADRNAPRESTAPTREQVEEAVEFLDAVMRAGAPQNEWEQSCVQRMRDALAARLESGEGLYGEGEGASEGPEPPSDEGATRGAVGGGEADEDEPKPTARGKISGGVTPLETKVSENGK